MPAVTTVMAGFFRFLEQSLGHQLLFAWCSVPLDAGFKQLERGCLFLCQRQRNSMNPLSQLNIPPSKKCNEIYRNAPIEIVGIVNPISISFGVLALIGLFFCVCITRHTKLLGVLILIAGIVGINTR